VTSPRPHSRERIFRACAFARPRHQKPVKAEYGDQPSRSCSFTFRFIFMSSASSVPDGKRKRLQSMSQGPICALNLFGSEAGSPGSGRGKS
jgi:hypothetical protein